MKPTTITDDRIAAVEIMAEDGPITSRMVGDELGLNTNNANHLIKKMVKLHLLEKGRPIWANGNWNDTYQTASTKPRQSSMFSSVKRDPLVKALFNDDNRDSEAAWVF
jgi:hypothetical protein